MPEPGYPAAAAQRRVRHNGEIKWNGDYVYVSQTLAGEAVALEETEQGEWTLRFYAHPLGIIDPRTKKLRRPLPSSQGHANPPQQSTGKL